MNTQELNELIIKLLANDSCICVDLSDLQITSLDGVIFPESLKGLYLENNQITSLDGVIFPERLECLDLQNNHITSLDGVKLPESLELG